jgi:outer membrane receptor protein involved in Fe transport
MNKNLMTGLVGLGVLASPVSAATLEEVVVTAQKRAQSLQDVGISISAWNGDDASRMGLGDIENLATATPGLQALDEAAGLPSFRVRGIGLNEFQAAFDSPVGVHLDEVFLSKPMLASMGFFDIERIEVLKGPQGTVFGRNTTGGAVNYYSNRPEDSFSAGFNVRYGRYERFESEAYLTGPLSDNVSGRLSMQWLDHGDGPYHNLATGEDLGDLDQQQLRAQLLWTPGDWQVHLALQFGQKEGQLTPYDNLFQAQPGGAPDVNAVIRNPYGRFTVNQDYFPTTDSESNSVVLRIERELGAADFVSITSFKDFERDNREDSDNTPGLTTNIDWYSQIDQFTQELRLSGEQGEWNYLVGAYFESDELTTVETLDASLLQELGLIQFAQLGADHQVDTRAFALFTSHEWRFNERLSVVAGARYSRERNEIAGQSFLTARRSAPIGAQDRIAEADRIVLVNADNSRTDSDVNFKLGVNYDLAENSLLYAYYSTGFRSGGYDLAFGSPSLESFDPEETASWELGLKSTLLDGAMTANVALFHTQIEDYQSNVNLAGELVPRRRNIGELETTGLEVEVQWQMLESTRLQLSGAYTDAEITQVANDANGQPFAVDGTSLLGNRPVNTPEFSASALLDYTRALTGELNLEALLSLSYSGSRFLEIQNGPDHEVDAYTTVDASVGLASADGRWRFSVWGKNLTDEEYLRYINDVPAFGLFLTINADPATYGIAFEYQL